MMEKLGFFRVWIIHDDGLKFRILINIIKYWFRQFLLIMERLGFLRVWAIHDNGLKFRILISFITIIFFSQLGNS